MDKKRVDKPKTYEVKQTNSKNGLCPWNTFVLHVLLMSIPLVAHFSGIYDGDDDLAAGFGLERKVGEDASEDARACGSRPSQPTAYL